MITALDTNVLIDVFRNDPVHGEGSAGRLREAIRKGALVVCDVVYAELVSVFAKPSDLDHALRRLGVGFDPLNQESAARAGFLWRSYRDRGGERVRVLADFLVGAHAQIQADQLLTRDRGFYRALFRGLRVVDPYAERR